MPEIPPTTTFEGRLNRASRVPHEDGNPIAHSSLLCKDKSGFPLKDCGNDRLKYESVYATVNINSA